jgi:hypothetical protein
MTLPRRPTVLAVVVPIALAWQAACSGGHQGCVWSGSRTTGERPKLDEAGVRGPDLGDPPRTPPPNLGGQPTVLLILVDGTAVERVSAEQGALVRRGATLPLDKGAALLDGDAITTGPATTVVVAGAGGGGDIHPASTVRFGHVEIVRGAVHWWREAEQSEAARWLDVLGSPDDLLLDPPGKLPETPDEP